MELVFHCLDAGRKLYGVLRQGREIFVGGKEECERFLELHQRKVERERADLRRPLRLPTPRPRRYKVVAPRAG